MRYREDTLLFWEVVLSVGGPRTLRLFSLDKHQGTVNSGECEKSKYNPQKRSFNFAVPDEKLLRKSKTGLPKCVKCGIIQESISLVDKAKEYADIAIKKLLQINVDWCSIMARINGNEEIVHKCGAILLYSMLNAWILRSPETLQLDDFLLKYLEYMKQRSDLWYSLRKECSVTGSTLHSAIGLWTLKEQKEHFKKFISKIDKPTEISKAMQHGIDNEVCNFALITNKMKFLISSYEVPMNFIRSWKAVGKIILNNCVCYLTTDQLSGYSIGNNSSGIHSPMS